MSSFAQAWRALAHRRAFTLSAVLTLALGIGITTTAFSIVNGVLLRPLAYPAGDQLVSLYEASPARGQRTTLIAPARIEDWQRLSSTFTAISGSYTENVTDTSGSQPERLAGRRVLPRFFEVFGTAPIAGRTFVPGEEGFGGSTAAVISEDLWARRYARSAAAIGSRLLVGGAGYTIVGVMPRAFSSAAIDVWLPAQLSPGLMQVREARFIGGVGRMRPGVTVAQARGDLARVQQALAAQYPRTDKNWSADVRDLKDVRVADYRRPLVVVFAAVALLFAIAIANVAGLVLVQLHRRAPELAIRAAIGASRAQIVGAVMREMLLLSVAGAALGAAGAFWLTRVTSAAFVNIPRIGEVALDGRALAFVVLASALATLVFGMVPALAASNARGSLALASVGRTVAGGRHRLQSALVIAQLAIGVVLAGTAGLLVRSYAAMTAVDPGFSAAGVMTFHVGAAWDEDRVRVGQLQERLLAAIEVLPGVHAAGYANFLPATGATLRSQVTVAGLPSDERGGAYTVGQRTVTTGYLKALSIPLVAGRWCGDPRADIAVTRVRDVLVNQAFLDRFAPGQTLIGRRLQFVQGPGAFQIAGVVGDVREDGPSAAAVPYVYACLAAGSWPDPEYVVRADGDPRALAAAIRAAVASLDASRPVFGVKALADVMNTALDQPRLNATALGAFAIAALGLAALGLYGLLMLVVGQRRRELGVRMALGATPRDLARVVIAGAGRLVVTGIAAGLVLTVAAGQLLRTLLFGVTPYDPPALAGSVIALTSVAAVAVLIPARRASRASALDAMRGNS